MARSRRARRATTTVSRGRDVITPVATLRVPLSAPSFYEVEDRRLFFPEPAARPALNRWGAPHVLRAPPTQRQPARPQSASPMRRLPHVVAFDAPRDVLICVRRKMRKQVLHALKKAGRNGTRRYRRNAFSNVSCRSY